MEKLTFDGKKYSLNFEGQEFEWEVEGRGDYSYWIYHYFNWRGTGKIENKESVETTTFLFQTTTLDKQWSRFFLYSFEDCIFCCRKPIRGEFRADSIYFQLSSAINQAGVIDYLAEQVLAELENIDRKSIIPEIKIPSLDLEELQLLSLAPEADGQLTLGVLV
ncbi:MAG: hypothetical protein NTW79_01365 [Candidatus Berkelbacteria bacterium]|nr:hypothetical protein [Candidatus Berkelbacteria bacterium]